jgi:hypothetical protein
MKAAGENAGDTTIRYHWIYLTFLAGLIAATATAAQVQPEIAYATAGGRPEIRLINADGTGRSLLYRGGSRSEIHQLDIKPGGGELAFEEHTTKQQGSASAIKIINYDANGSPIGLARILQLTCRAGSLDYHPTDGTLIYHDCRGLNRIRRLNTTTLASEDLGLSHDAVRANWIDATHILYYAQQRFWTVSTDALDSPIGPYFYPSFGSLDISTSGLVALWSEGSQISYIDVASLEPRRFLAPGLQGHFSSDDHYVAYITGSSVGQKGQYIIIRGWDLAGAPTNLVGQGSFTALDWRN